MHQNAINIHQYHQGTQVGDGITNAMLTAQQLFRNFGFGSNVYADGIDPDLRGSVSHFTDLRPQARDILLIHHGWHQDHLPYLAKLPCRKFLVFHSITPPHFFPKGSGNYNYSLSAFDQLGALLEIVEGAVAISDYNAGQLRRRGFSGIHIIPLLKEFERLRELPHRKFPYYDTSPVWRVLFVGRIVPHKCQDQLVRVIGEIGAFRGIPLELVLAGRAEDAAYAKEIERTIIQCGLDGRVRLIGHIPDDELLGHYRAANAYLSFSEHEGFGIPLIEAMALDLPVIAYSAAGISDTLGGAGILIADKSAATIRTQLVRLHDDPGFRTETIRRQRDRVQYFSSERIRHQLYSWLQTIGVANVAAMKARDFDRLGRSPAHANIHYVVEGPFETSYSLAYNNRNIAQALNQLPSCTASILPGEGKESYEVDLDAASRLPGSVRGLVAPPPLTSDSLVTIRHTYPSRPNGMLGDVRLLHFPWEESIISSSLAEQMNTHLDGVLVASQFVRNVLRDSGVRLPIAVIGHGIDEILDNIGPIHGDRGQRTRHAESPFTFLHVSSGLARKGVEELILAYTLAFTSTEPVLLVIKTIDNEQNEVRRWVDRVTGERPTAPIQVIAEDVPPEQMRELYGHVDAMVLPTRGEAFNFPAAEAMAAGLPLIVTGHTGHLDYCDANNARLVDFEFEQSTSHVHVPNALWVRASLPDLIAAMRQVFREGRTSGTPTMLRAQQAVIDTQHMRWHAVARKIDDFVRDLKKRPIMARKLRVAWVSTYNSRCGIATYSENLLAGIDRELIDISVVANDEISVKPDPDNVHRLWTARPGTLDRTLEYLLKHQFDAVIFQFNYAFFELHGFATALELLQEHGLDTYVMFHKTAEAHIDGQVESIAQIAPVLSRCSRLFVHGIEDVARLKTMKLIDNVTLLPHGINESPPIAKSVVQALLGLNNFYPIIGSFGFLVPPKGVPHLIRGFASIHARHPRALLLLICSEYPTSESKQEYSDCLALCRAIGLEDNVLLVNDFLEDEAEAMLLLSACDAIVFGYQFSGESASGAVRVALATGRPVGTTPIGIFSELAELVYQFRGTDSGSIADGINAMLDQSYEGAEFAQKQRAWIRENSWSTQAARIQNIMLGCFEDKCGARVRPLQTGQEPEQSGLRHSRAPAGPEGGGRQLNAELSAVRSRR